MRPNAAKMSKRIDDTRGIFGLQQNFMGINIPWLGAESAVDTKTSSGRLARRNMGSQFVSGLDDDTVEQAGGILKGKLRVDFYSDKEKYLFSKIIKKNDIIILNSGGHGFKVIEAVEMIEVKQGPYNITTDKKVFDNINDNVVKLK